MDNMIIVFIISILYCSIYMFNDMWNNVKLYTPNWGDKITVYSFIYIILLLVYISYIIKKDKTRIDKFILIMSIITFSFSIYSLSESTLWEAFVFSTIALFIILSNVIITFISKDHNSRLSAVAPLLAFIYFYSWLIETKENHVD